LFVFSVNLQKGKTGLFVFNVNLQKGKTGLFVFNVNLQKGKTGLFVFKYNFILVKRILALQYFVWKSIFQIDIGNGGVEKF